jgi:predicted phage terminase large subunit-like protein
MTPPKDAPPLRQFVKDGWHVVEPGMPVIWNWHLDAICDHLEAVSDGDIRNLVLNIPPGHAKSVVIGVLWPAWMWIHRPEWRALFSSYDQSLVTRDATRCREVLQSEWYQAEYAPKWRLKNDQNTKTFFKNTRQGFRFCHTVAGRGTGHRGDAIVCDDPLNARHRHSVKKREAAIDWWNRTMPTRLNDPRSGVKVIIMQRLHEEDLTAEVLKHGGYVHLNLMSRFVPEKRTITVLVDKATGQERELFRDPRKERGELLFPELFTEQVLDDLETQMGPEDFSAQHQQDPKPAEGGMFKERYFGYWCYPGQKLPSVKVKLPDGEILEVEPVELPRHFDKQVQSWDLTFKQKKTSDFVVGQVWGAKEADRFLLHQYRDRAGFDKSVEALLAVVDAWPEARTRYIEDKANGSAILDHLHSKVSGLIAVEPRGDKEERAWAVQPSFRSGNVYLPHPMIASWVPGFIDEFTSFPNGKDDQVDAASQALDQLANDAAAEASMTVSVALPPPLSATFGYR